jgi:hypothetical protein
MLFDEMRDLLRLATELPQEETPQEIEDMRKQFDNWIASLEKRRSARGSTRDIHEAVDVILKHNKKHGRNLWGHAIIIAEGTGLKVRLLSRTNFLLENLFKHMKHGERRRSGRRILTQDLENMPAEAMLAYNLEQNDYVNIICGSLDQLPEAFAKLDQEEKTISLMEIHSPDRDDLADLLQIATASLSTLDRRVVRTKAMDFRMRTAAASRVPRYHI